MFQSTQEMREETSEIFLVIFPAGTFGPSLE